jgi:putative membrane protein
MRGFILGTAVTAIAFYILTKILPQNAPWPLNLVTYEGETVGLVVLAIIFGVVNGFVGPIVRMLAFPFKLMTLGLVGFVVNAVLLLVTAVVANTTGFDLTVGDFPPTLLTVDTIVGAVVGAVVLSLVGTAARLVVPD